MLKAGTTKCKDCKVDLHWHQIQGIRLVETEKGIDYYRARCPQCGNYFRVRK